MTVHGAKGLQAPLVILPDTTALPPDDGALLWADDPAYRRRRSAVGAAQGAPLRRGRTAARGPVGAADRGAQPAALRRADPRRGPAGGLRLAAGPAGTGDVLVQPGATRLRRAAGPGGAVRPAARAPGPASRYAMTARRPCRRAGRWSPSRPPAPPPAAMARRRTGVDRRAAARRSRRARCRSRPAGRRASTSAGARRRSPRWRRARRAAASAAASLLHALLQHLPKLPAAAAGRRGPRLARPRGDRAGEAVAADLARRGAGGAGPSRPAPLFGPDSRAEVPLTGVIGGIVVGGLVDRLAVLPDGVLVADYKTNRRPPAGRYTPVALPAPDGRLPRGAARSSPRPDRARIPGLDRVRGGDGTAGVAARRACAGRGNGRAARGGKVAGLSWIVVQPPPGRTIQSFVLARRLWDVLALFKRRGRTFRTSGRSGTRVTRRLGRWRGFDAMTARIVSPLPVRVHVAPPSALTQRSQRARDRREGQMPMGGSVVSHPSAGRH